MAEVRPRRVTLAACGGHEPVRDVSRVRQGGFSGQTGGFCPHGGLSRGVFRVQATGERHAKCALKNLYAVTSCELACFYFLAIQARSKA
jgi:hypothetical protein